jgi:hypothetical protein
MGLPPPRDRLDLERKNLVELLDGHGSHLSTL